MKLRNLILISSLVLMSVSCNSGKKEEVVVKDEVKVEKVRVATLKNTEIDRKLDFSTTLLSYEEQKISPSVTGVISKIYVEPGDRVRKGDMLVMMDEMQYKTTKLTFANLEIEMERMKSLREKGAVAQQAYDKAELGYSQTKENLEFLKANTYVKADFSGVISAKTYEDGELYSGQPILVLSQINKLKALVNIPEKYFPVVKKGETINITSNIYPEEVFASKIEMVYPTIDAQSHTFIVKLQIPNGSEKLRPGMYVNTAFSVGKSVAMIVPYQSVLKLIGSNERYVYVNNGGVAERVFVKLGQRFDDQIEIISDELTEGTELVVTGQAKLVTGTKLNIVD